MRKTTLFLTFFLLLVLTISCSKAPVEYSFELNRNGLFLLNGKEKTQIASSSEFIDTENKIIQGLRTLINSRLDEAPEISQRVQVIGKMEDTETPEPILNWFRSTADPYTRLNIDINGLVPFYWVKKLFNTAESAGIDRFQLRTSSLTDTTYTALCIKGWDYIPLNLEKEYGGPGLIDPRIVIPQDEEESVKLEFINTNLFIDYEGISISLGGAQKGDNFKELPRVKDGYVNLSKIRRTLRNINKQQIGTKHDVNRHFDPFIRETITLPVYKYADANILTVNIRPDLPWHFVWTVLEANLKVNDNVSRTYFPLIIFNEFYGTISGALEKSNRRGISARIKSLIKTNQGLYKESLKLQKGINEVELDPIETVAETKTEAVNESTKPVNISKSGNSPSKFSTTKSSPKSAKPKEVKKEKKSKKSEPKVNKKSSETKDEEKSVIDKQADKPVKKNNIPNTIPIVRAPAKKTKSEKKALSYREQLLSQAKPVVPYARNKTGIQKKIKDEEDSMKSCYKIQKRKSPKLTGKISVRFVITKTGNIGNIEVLESNWTYELPGLEVERCVKHRVKNWRFEKGKNKITQDFSLNFY